MTGRFQSFASLGLLSALAAGFGLWSAFSGPQIAAVQLHVAAANTLAASGFIETFQLAAIGQASSSKVTTTTIDYQAPDRFAFVGSYEVNGSKVPTELRTTQIGSACWQEPAADKPGAPSAESTCAPSGSSQFLSVLQDLEDASEVTFRGGVYSVDQQDTGPFVRAVYGPFAKLFEGQSVEVRTDGSYVSWLQIVLDLGPGRYKGDPYQSVVMRFTEVGTAPPVVRPVAGPGPTATTLGG